MEYKKKYKKQYDYLLECLYDSNWTHEATPEECIDNFIKKFHCEYDTPDRRKDYPFILDRIAQYLRGLPSSCSVTFCTYDIIQIGKDWGYVTDEKSENSFDERWWKILAERIYEMVHYYDREFIAEPYNATNYGNCC